MIGLIIPTLFHGSSAWGRNGLPHGNELVGDILRSRRPSTAAFMPDLCHSGMNSLERPACRAGAFAVSKEALHL